MLCLTVLPILGLWAYTVYTLADIIEAKNENESVNKSFDDLHPFFTYCNCILFHISFALVCYRQEVLLSSALSLVNWSTIFRKNAI